MNKEQVINGMSEKLEKFIDNTDNKFKLVGSKIEDIQKIQIKKLNNKIEAVDKVNDDRITEVKSILVDDYEGKIELLENKMKNKMSTNGFNIKLLNDKLEKLENINLLNADRNIKSMEHFESIADDIKALYKLDRSNENAIIKVNSKCNILERDFKVLYEGYDELEAKYYNLRSELDGIYKVLEMDSDDIQELQDKIFNETMKEGHETIKRVKNRNDFEINNHSDGNEIFKQDKLVNEVAEYEAEQMLIDENNKLNEEE